MLYKNIYIYINTELYMYIYKKQNINIFAENYIWWADRLTNIAHLQPKNLLTFTKLVINYVQQ